MIRPAYIFIPLWLFVVAGLSWWIGPPIEGPPEQWKAARDLPRNHQLQDTDLIGPKKRHIMAKMIPREDLLTKHLAVKKNKGDPIEKSDVNKKPGFSPIEKSKGLLLYSLKGEEFLAEGVDVGSWVFACFIRQGENTTKKMTTRCTRRPLEVEAVHRASSKTDSTWVALRVRECHIQEIGEFLAREKRLMLVAANSPPPICNG